MAATIRTIAVANAFTAEHAVVAEKTFQGDLLQSPPVLSAASAVKSRSAKYFENGSRE